MTKRTTLQPERNGMRFALLALPVAALLIVVVLVGPIAQDPTYHRFADTRSLLSVPNFWNVASNLPFLVVGLWGARFIGLHGHHVIGELRPAWMIFFVGVGLTAFGSGYYHWSPDNHSLAWDRLTMTVGFMSLFAAVLGEYISAPLAHKLLRPLLIMGAASVVYWLHTEALGAGDLRPYALVQFLPMVLIPLIALLFRDRSDLGPYLGWMIACYALAKMAEHYDAQILSATGLLSGHSIKHVAAALGAAGLLAGLTRRQ